MTEVKDLVEDLRRAIIRGELKTIQEMVKKGASLEENLSRRKRENTLFPLHYSILEKKSGIAKWLIQNGAQINAECTGAAYPYPILLAASEGKLDILQSLIDAGAGIQVTDKNGWTALDHAAVYDGSAAAPMIKALIKAGAQIERNSLTWGTPLIKACWSANLAAVRALIESGANVNAVTMKSTPLIQAIDLHGRGLDKKSEKKSLEVVAALLAAGADPNLRFNWHEANRHNEGHIGKTPLEFAREQKRKKMVVLLATPQEARPAAPAAKQLGAADIAAIWKNLEKALRKEAPELKKSLGKAATNADLSKLEAAVGVPLPDDFKASYLIHNGMKDGEQAFVPEEWLNEPYYLMPLEQILQEWKMMKELVDIGEFSSNESAPDDGIAPHWWHPSWIPFISNGGGDSLCIDLAPTKKGTRGQVIQYSHESDQRRLIARSFAAFLNELVDHWSQSE